MRKTIFINGRFLTHPVTGVQRYSLELIRHMDLILEDRSVFPSLQLVCLTPPEKFDRPAWKNIRIHPIGVNKGNVWEQTDLPFYTRGRLLFSPANIGPWHYRHQAVTFHDAGVFAVPDAYSRAFRLKYAFIFRQLVRRARLLFTVSQFSRGELSRYLGVPAERFTVIPAGSDHLDHVQSDASILTRHGLRENAYLLTVASQVLHKNLDNIVEARKIMETSIKIVSVGARSERIYRGNVRRQFADEVHDLGYVTDGELKALYENALGLMLASIYEGFGLPVLEAMRCGCPVICSRAAALPEVAGEAALYFDPGNVEDMAKALDRFVSDERLRGQLRAEGYKRASGFEWQDSARALLDRLAGVTEMQPSHDRFSRVERLVKRLLDLAIIVTALPLILLLLAMISLAIRLDSQGPVFYSQKRIGFMGKEITVWKFRSMAVDAEEILQSFLGRSPSMKSEWEDSHKLKNDPRVARFGKILRHTSLDELPQIWNVLRGEMSLIGPRPIVEEELELYGEDFEIYKQALPGLTGMWQISGRNDLPYEDRVNLDVYYIRNWSIWLDMHILFQTILVTIQGRGAY